MCSSCCCCCSFFTSTNRRDDNTYAHTHPCTTWERGTFREYTTARWYIEILAGLFHDLFMSVRNFPRQTPWYLLQMRLCCDLQEKVWKNISNNVDVSAVKLELELRSFPKQAFSSKFPVSVRFPIGRTIALARVHASFLAYRGIWRETCSDTPSWVFYWCW